MYNRVKEQIDSFINSKIVEVMKSEKYYNKNYEKTERYSWGTDEGETLITIAVSHKVKEV